MRHLIFSAVCFYTPLSPSLSLFHFLYLSLSLALCRPNRQPNGKRSQGQLRYHCQHAIESSPSRPSRPWSPLNPSHRPLVSRIIRAIPKLCLSKRHKMWPSMVLVRTHTRTLFYLFFACHIPYSLSFFFFFFGTSFLTPAFRYVSRRCHLPRHV